MKELTITERKNNGVLILDLAGQIRIGDNSLKLRDTLKNCVLRGEKNLIVNLEQVTHIDSSGLGDLVAGHVSAENKGGVLKLLHLTDHVSELMMITKLLTVFDTFDDEETAVASFEMDSADKNADSVPVAAGS